MPEEKVLPKDRIASSFKQLAAVSAELNSVAKELGKFIASFEEALNGLNLGVSAWHQIAGHEDHNTGEFWRRDIGYTKMGGEWRIALRSVEGYLQDPTAHDEENWRFSDAPRWMCAEAAGKLPDLFETLIKRAAETREKIRARIPAIEELAAALRSAQAEMDVEKPKKRVKLI